MNTHMTVKGRVVIPSRARRQLGVSEGTRIHVEVDEAGNRIVLTPITRKYVLRICGKYRGKGLLKALAAEKRRARGR